MKTRKVFLIIMLIASFCFVVSGVGYGEVLVDLWKKLEVSYISYLLSNAKVDYIMRNPTSFSDIEWSYDEGGWSTLLGGWPSGVDTEKKTVIDIRDSRNIYFNKSAVALLESFKKALEVVYSFVKSPASFKPPNMKELTLLSPNTALIF